MLCQVYALQNLRHDQTARDGNIGAVIKMTLGCLYKDDPNCSHSDSCYLPAPNSDTWRVQFANEKSPGIDTTLVIFPAGSGSGAKPGGVGTR